MARERVNKSRRGEIEAAIGRAAAIGQQQGSGNAGQIDRTCWSMCVRWCWKCTLVLACWCFTNKSSSLSTSAPVLICVAEGTPGMVEYEYE